MQELIEALKEIEQATDLVNRYMYDDVWWLTNGSWDDLDPRVARAVELACGYLIDSDGGCNWDAHDILKKNGFRVTCGERDSFGWLSGIIHTKQGRIVYG